MDAKDELENLLSKINENGKISMQGYVDILTEGLGIILPDILTQLKALTERVKELEDIGKRYEQLEIFCFNKYLEDQPVPEMSTPVLNDGKADPVHEAICKAPDNTFICQQCGHVHELPQFQQSPFVTGLSVLDSLKK